MATAARPKGAARPPRTPAPSLHTLEQRLARELDQMFGDFSGLLEYANLATAFDALVDVEIARRYPDRTTLDARIEAYDAISAALPSDLRTLKCTLSDEDGGEAFVRQDLAYALGVAIGRHLAGGAR